ncbi:MAG: TolC family protein, partial [Betaproteobacteria bacterium]
MPTQHKKPNLLGVAVIGTIAAMLASCSVGPNYHRPTVDVGTAYKELTDWKPAEPKDELIRGKWWQVFADAELNELAAQIDVSNQSLKAAEARYRQAVALVKTTRAGYFPTISANAGATRSRAASRGGVDAETFNSYDAGLGASWEIDVWGRVRRQVESNKASADASDADLEAVRLSLQSELAINYFQLRVTDEQKQLLDDTVAAYQRSLELTNNRYKVGVAAKGDVVQAQAQLRSTEA